jgi:hypothetical protein
MANYQWLMVLATIQVCALTPVSLQEIVIAALFVKRHAPNVKNSFSTAHDVLRLTLAANA